MEVPKEVALKPASEWKYIGVTKLKRLDTQMKVTGTAGFGIDTRVPGMLYAESSNGTSQGGKIANMMILEPKICLVLRQLFSIQEVLQLLLIHIGTLKKLKTY